MTTTFHRRRNMKLLFFIFLNYEANSGICPKVYDIITDQKYLMSHFTNT